MYEQFIIKRMHTEKLSMPTLSMSLDLESCNRIIKYGEKIKTEKDLSFIVEYQSLISNRLNQIEEDLRELEDIANHIKKVKAYDNTKEDCFYIGQRKIFKRYEEDIIRFLYFIGYDKYEDSFKYGYFLFSPDGKDGFSFGRSDSPYRELIFASIDNLTEYFSGNYLDSLINQLKDTTSLEELKEVGTKVEQQIWEIFGVNNWKGSRSVEKVICGYKLNDMFVEFVETKHKKSVYLLLEKAGFRNITDNQIKLVQTQHYISVSVGKPSYFDDEQEYQEHLNKLEQEKYTLINALKDSGLSDQELSTILSINY